MDTVPVKTKESSLGLDMLDIIEYIQSDPKKGLDEMLQLLQSYTGTEPVNVDESNSSGYTPLMIAARYCRTFNTTELVKLLLQYGANPNWQSTGGYTSLMLAIKEFQVDGVRMQNTFVGSMNEVVELLLRHGANPNLQNKCGWTALMYTRNYLFCEVGDIIKMLLQYGANPNLQNDNGANCLMELALSCNLRRDAKSLLGLLMDTNGPIGSLTLSEYGKATQYIADSLYQIAEILLQYGVIANYEILQLFLRNDAPDILIAQMISTIVNIPEFEFIILFNTFAKYRNLLKQLLPRIIYKDNRVSVNDLLGHEKIYKINLQKKYSQILCDIPTACNQIIYKDTSFGGWITVKKLETTNVQETFEKLSVSNNSNDRKYMDMFCIFDVARLEALLAYH